MGRLVNNIECRFYENLNCQVQILKTYQILMHAYLINITTIYCNKHFFYSWSDSSNTFSLIISWSNNEKYMMLPFLLSFQISNKWIVSQVDWGLDKKIKRTGFIYVNQLCNILYLTFPLVNAAFKHAQDYNQWNVKFTNRHHKISCKIPWCESAYDRNSY